MWLKTLEFQFCCPALVNTDQVAAIHIAVGEVSGTAEVYAVGAFGRQRIAKVGSQAEADRIVEAIRMAVVLNVRYLDVAMVLAAEAAVATAATVAEDAADQIARHRGEHKE